MLRRPIPTRRSMGFHLFFPILLFVSGLVGWLVGWFRLALFYYSPRVLFFQGDESRSILQVERNHDRDVSSK